MSAATVSARVLTFVRLGRPLFLVGGFVVHGLGAAAALYAGAGLNLPALLWGQLAITATQLMVHYANDYFDLDADRANATATAWSGGSRVLPDGLLPPRVALAAALVLGLVALVTDLVLGLVVRPEPPVLPLLLLALVLSWGYSAPPLQLDARGLGQLTAVFVVSGLTPLVGFALQAGRLALLPALALAPVACLQFAMLVAVDIPDVAGDALAGKRTLVVRLGIPRAARLYRALLLAAYVLLPCAVLAGLPPLVAAAAAVTAPLAAWQAAYAGRIARGRPADLNLFIFLSIALLIGTAGLEVLAFLA